jgi:hypothetical protein
MLSDLIETAHIESFRLALYHLERFDIQGCEWSIDQKNRVQCSTVNADCWGDLGFVEDWYIERIVPDKDEWSPSLSTTRSVYSKRKKALKSFYSIGHRTKTRSRSVTGSKLPKRRRIFTVSPWKRFIESYLSDRRKKRLLTGDNIRYQPTDNDIESILIVSAPFVLSSRRQVEISLDLYSKRLELKL